MTDTIQRSGTDPDRDDKPREPFLGLSPLQLMGGALAAITTAVVSSYLGVAGTLIGAALASILTTIGGAFYTQSMTAARGRIAGGLSTLADRRRGGDSEHRTGSTALEETLTVDTRHGLPSRLRAAVGRVSTRAWIGTAAVFLMAIVAITGFEMATGKPVSATVTGGASAGTTIGSVVDPGGQGTTGTTEEGSTPQETPQQGTTADEATPTPGQSEQESVQPVPDTTQAPGEQNPVPERTQAPGEQNPLSEQTQQPEPAQSADPGQGDADGGQQQPAPTQQPAPQQEAPGQGQDGGQAPVPDNG